MGFEPITISLKGCCSNLDELMTQSSSWASIPELYRVFSRRLEAIISILIELLEQMFVFCFFQKCDLQGQNYFLLSLVAVVAYVAIALERKQLSIILI